MKAAWWMGGVPFACQPNCGRCCDQPGGIVYLSIRDAERIASHHEMEVEAWLERDCRKTCLLYTSPSPRDATLSRMPSSA